MTRKVILAALFAAMGGTLSACVAYEEPSYRYRDYSYRDAPVQRERDRDRDGIPDRRDRDRDGDRVPNRQDRSRTARFAASRVRKVRTVPSRFTAAFLPSFTV
jgi:hypothetical protein